METGLSLKLSNFHPIKISRKKEKKILVSTKKVGVTKNVSSPTIFIRFRSGWSHSIGKWKAKSLPYQFFEFLFLSRDIWRTTRCIKTNKKIIHYKHRISTQEQKFKNWYGKLFAFHFSIEWDQPDRNRMKIVGLLTFLRRNRLFRDKRTMSHLVTWLGLPVNGLYLDPEILKHLHKHFILKRRVFSTNLY